MSFEFDEEEFERDVKIKVVGVGGGGGNAVENMVRNNVNLQRKTAMILRKH